MKQLTKLFLLMLSIAIMQCCASEDPFEEYVTNNSGGTYGGASSSAAFSSNVQLTTFDVSIDKTSTEPSTTATAYLPDGDDSFEATDFATVVAISFDANSATVSAVDGVTVSTDGAHVTVDHGETKGICYQVTGTTTNGSLTISGSKKYEVMLNNAHISNPDSTALNMLSTKRAFLVMADGTTNSLADGSTSKASDQKAALYCKGKLIVCGGSGTLEVTGNYKNAIHSADYIVFYPGTNVYAKSTANHGIKANDGIIINGGIINVEVTAAAAKGLNCESNITVNGGRTTVITTGESAWDSDDEELKGCAAVKCDSVFTINGGEMWLKSTGAGGKGIRADWEAYVNGGTIAILTTGGQHTYNRDTVSPKGMKIGTKGTHGVLSISGGSLMVHTTGSGGEGIESKGTIDINGSNAMVAVASTDDAINSASDMTIAAGNVLAYATGNDGLDANGNLYIKGGTVYAIGSQQPEVAIDANSEGGYKLYLTGGTLVAIGGLESGSSLSQTCYSTSWTPNTWYGLSGGGNTLAFLTPASGGSTLVVSTASTPTLSSGIATTDGTSLWGGMGLSSATWTGGSQASLSAYSGGNGGMGGPGGGMGGGMGGHW